MTFRISNGFLVCIAINNISLHISTTPIAFQTHFSLKSKSVGHLFYFVITNVGWLLCFDPITNCVINPIIN